MAWTLFETTPYSAVTTVVYWETNHALHVLPVVDKMNNGLLQSCIKNNSFASCD